MSSSAVPFIECEQVHAGLAVTDIPTAVEFYIKKLGFQQAFTWGEPQTFAGVNLGKVQMFLAKGTPTPSPDTGAVYFLVGDADQLDGRGDDGARVDILRPRSKVSVARCARDRRSAGARYWGDGADRRSTGLPDSSGDCDRRDVAVRGDHAVPRDARSAGEE